MRDDKIEMEGIISCVRELDLLKNVTRTAWTSKGRRESTAEHSWRLALFALMLRSYFPAVDFCKVVALCLVHDLGEAYDGDISAKLQPDPIVKARQEASGVRRLLRDLPDLSRGYILELVEEYNRGVTREAKIVKALDKIETIIQHNQGLNPPDFDYRYNLEYGKALCKKDRILGILRQLVDDQTARRMEGQDAEI